MYWKSRPNLYHPYLQSRIRKGLGTGAGLQYSPWLKAQRVPSEGTSSILPGIIVRRPYHFLSELETIYFHLLERRPTIVDVREQWPILDIDRTLELCARYGVRHKYLGRFPEPFTLDFLITELVDGQISYRAASIKSADDAGDNNVRKRLKIEYEWCAEHDLPWTLVDCSTFDKTMLSTLRFMRGWFSDRYHPEAEKTSKFVDLFLSTYGPNVMLDELVSKVAEELRLTKIEAQNTFRYCAWIGQINVSLRHTLAFNKPVVLIESNGYD